MGWFKRTKDKGKEKKKEPQRKRVSSGVKTPICDKCGAIIECMDVSIGDVLEEQGACVYSGSEGHLYEPLYEGSICMSCKTMLCDNCLMELVDKTICPKCGGYLRTITPHRLPKAEK